MRILGVYLYIYSIWYFDVSGARVCVFENVYVGWCI